MARFSSRDEISEKALGRLVSLSSAASIAQARAEGHDDVVPADLKPSARNYLDPRTGKLFSRRQVQEAKSFYEGELALSFRSIKEVTNESVRREKILQEAGLTFPTRDWSARYERDLRVQAIEKAYRQRHKRAASWREGSPFREALSRLSQATPPGVKHWESDRARVEKTKALEVLGLRPPGFKPLTGAYTPAQLAAAWRRAGRRQPRLDFHYKKTR